MDRELKDCARVLKGCRNVAVLTGAGISAESGVHTFRGKGGLWEKHDAEDLATIEGFKRDPKAFWEWFDERRQEIAKARPNAAHLALAEMERSFDSFSVITQNIDGLHRLAKSTLIIELHGNVWRVKCTRDREASENRDVPLGEIPPLCYCGAVLRPDVVLFGESLDPVNIDRAYLLSETCNAMLVVGTSAVVYPAAQLPLIAKRVGAIVVEVNHETTPLTQMCDFSFRESAAKVLPDLVKLLSQ